MNPVQYIETPQPRNPKAPVPTYAFAGMAVPVVMIILCIGCTWEGISTTAKTAVREEILTPTPREVRVLEAYALNAQTEQGQKKLRKYRQRQKQLEETRERLLARYNAGRDSGSNTNRVQYLTPQEGIHTLVYSLQVRDPVPLGGL